MLKSHTFSSLDMANTWGNIYFDQLNIQASYAYSTI